MLQHEKDLIATPEFRKLVTWRVGREVTDDELSNYYVSWKQETMNVMMLDFKLEDFLVLVLDACGL